MTSLYPRSSFSSGAPGHGNCASKVDPQQVLIVDIPKKWGSCSPEGVVTFADKLAEADEEFQD